MKKIIFVLLVLVSSIVFSQEKEENKSKYPQDIYKKHEVKINVLTALAAKWLDVSYEKLIDEESSYGISLAINSDHSLTDLNYSLTPYYRRYFSGKFARGFFVEGFGMLISTKDNFFFNDSDEFETGFGLGISVGGKFVSKKGFTTELLLGVGRNFNDNFDNDVIGRIGISVGYRF